MTGLRQIWAAAARTLRGFVRSRDGGLAVIVAICLPVLCVLACGVVELSSVRSDYNAMQDTADATALAAAKQLGMATATGVAARAQDFAQAQLGDVAKRVTFTVTTTVADSGSAVTVAINGSRPSFFGNLLPLGGWKLNVQATAQAVGEVPLCVLATGSQNNDGIQLNGSSATTAPSCLVQSDSNIHVTGSSTLQAAMVQAVGTVQGTTTPAAQPGAPAIGDPFASLTVQTPSPTCSPYNVTYLSTGVNTLPPGEHCGNMVVQNGAVLQLLPGEHYFTNAHLTMQGAAALQGSDVVLIFDKNSQFNFTDQSDIELGGRQSGPFAGFVIATTRANTQDFNISSNSARKLLGTVYIPSAKLHVTGQGNQVAEQSAWTVIVANAIQTDGSANLVINSNYASSAVPVPGGVGVRSGDVILTK